MNALRNWLIANNHATTDPSEVRDRLSDQVELRRDDDRYTPAGIGKIIGRDDLFHLLDKLETTPGMKPSLVIITGGIYLSDAETREFIMGLQQAGLLSEANAVKLLNQGIECGPVWTQVGLESLPTGEEIQAVQATIATEELRETFAAKCQGVRRAIDAGIILNMDAANNLYNSPKQQVIFSDEETNLGVNTNNIDGWDIVVGMKVFVVASNDPEQVGKTYWATGNNDAWQWIPQEARA